MAGDDALITEMNIRVEARIEEATRVWDAKEHWGLGALWVILAPAFAYLGSDGWTSNVGVAAAMGPLGALVLCMQLRAVTGIYKRKFLARIRKEFINEWRPEEAGAEST